MRGRFFFVLLILNCFIVDKSSAIFIDSLTSQLFRHNPNELEMIMRNLEIKGPPNSRISEKEIQKNLVAVILNRGSDGKRKISVRAHSSGHRPFFWRAIAFRSYRKVQSVDLTSQSKIETSIHQVYSILHTAKKFSSTRAIAISKILSFTTPIPMIQTSRLFFWIGL